MRLVFKILIVALIVLFPFEAYSANRGPTNASSYIYPGTTGTIQRGFPIDAGLGPTCPLPTYSAAEPKLAGTGVDGITQIFEVNANLNNITKSNAGFPLSGSNDNFLGQPADGQFVCTYDEMTDRTGNCKNIPMVTNQAGNLVPRHGTSVYVWSGARIQPLGVDGASPGFEACVDTDGSDNPCTGADPACTNALRANLVDKRVVDGTPIVNVNSAGAPPVGGGIAFCMWDARIDAPAGSCTGTGCSTSITGTYVDNLQRTGGIWRSYSPSAGTISDDGGGVKPSRWLIKSDTALAEFSGNFTANAQKYLLRTVGNNEAPGDFHGYGITLSDPSGASAGGDEGGMGTVIRYDDHHRLAKLAGRVGTSVAVINEGGTATTNTNNCANAFEVVNGNSGEAAGSHGFGQIANAECVKVQVSEAGNTFGPDNGFKQLGIKRLMVWPDEGPANLDGILLSTAALGANGSTQPLNGTIAQGGGATT